MRWLSSTNASSYSSPPCTCLKLRVRDKLVGPMPSDTMKIKFLLPVGLFQGPAALGAGCEPWVCWYMTARTTTATVATRAQAKMPTSRQKDQPYLRDWGLCWPVRRASSSSTWRDELSEEARERRGSSPLDILIGGLFDEGRIDYRGNIALRELRLVDRHRVQLFSR